MAKGHNRHREQKKQKKERLPGEGEKRKERKITAIVAGKGGRKAATRDARSQVHQQQT